MDGRRWSCFALALSLGLGGCVPNQLKTTSVESQPMPPSEPAEAPSKSLNPFAAAPKREPKLELALAGFSERKASGKKDNPEQQFRDLDDARRAYQEILNYDNKNLDAHRGLGRVYVAQGDFERASLTFKKAIELHPKTAILYADLSIVHSKQNDFTSAIQNLNKAREIDPENREFLKMLGVNLFCAGQVDQGIEMLTRAGGKAAAHYYVARLFDRKNQPAEARRHVQLALEYNANLADARTFLMELDQRSSRPMNPPVGLQFVSE
jgi:tetratricopeptide (TPR) repeat protein